VKRGERRGKGRRGRRGGKKKEEVTKRDIIILF